MKTRITSVLIAAGCLFFAVRAPAPTLCPPDPITVTTTADSGPGSLREAILAANLCPDANTIVLNGSATYTLTNADNYWYGPNALPEIASPIIIEGNGATIERDTNSPSVFRLFYV